MYINHYKKEDEEFQEDEFKKALNDVTMLYFNKL